MSASSESGTSAPGTTPPEDMSYQSGRTGRRRTPIMTGAGVGIVVAVIAIVSGWAIGYYTAPGSSGGVGLVQITETGSSLLYPAVNNQWGPNYTSQYSNIVVDAASTGSGTGQSDAEAGLVDIGASDAYLSNASATNLVNFPLAISSQLVYYNLPGITTHLNLNATVIGMMYTGAITNWNNSLIQAANPNVTLPSNPIIPVARSDSSGDTFLITSYFYMGWAGWAAAGHTYSTAELSGTLNSRIIFESGNGGMVTGASGAPYTIAYIGVSYMTSAASKGLVYANLGDQLANSASGGVNPSNYIAWSPTNVSYDANLALTKLNFATYGLALSMILGGPAGGAIDLTAGGGGTAPTAASRTPYPDVNLEYALVKTTGNPGGATHAYYVVQFLQWVITVGNLPQFLNPVSFLPLTTGVLTLDYQVLLTIHTQHP